MSRSNSVDGLDLSAVKQVLYKIFGLQREHIPEGARLVERKSNKEMDKRHADRAQSQGKGKLAVEGRVRPDRVDTGIPYNSRPGEWVKIASIRSILALKGFRLADMHFFDLGQAGCTLVLDQRLEENIEGAPFVLTPGAVDQLRLIGRERVFQFSGWDNSPTDGPITLNFRQWKWGLGDANRMLGVRERFLKLVDLQGRDPDEIEREEDLLAAKSLEETLGELAHHIKL